MGKLQKTIFMKKYNLERITTVKTTTKTTKTRTRPARTTLTTNIIVLLKK